MRLMSSARRKCWPGFLVGMLLLLPASFIAAHEAGELDRSFGVAGKVLTDLTGDNDEGQAVVLQPNGKIVMVGNSSNSTTGFVEFVLTRYLPDGNLDPTFGGDGVVTTSFGDTSAITHTAAVQPDGRIIAAGYTIDNGVRALALARYLPNGNLDRSFGGDGKVTLNAGESEVHAILLQSDRKIIAVGTRVLARLHRDGSLDETFGTDGFVDVEFDQFAGAQQRDGRIVTAGTIFNTSISHQEFALARFLSNGTLDNTFHGDGRVDTDLGGGGDARVSAVLIQPNGRIIAAGDVFNAASGHVDFALVRYRRNGKLDPTFDGDGMVTTDFGSASQAFAAILQPDLKIVAAGYAFGVFGLARYLPNGALDSTFSDDGLVTTSFGAGDNSFVRGLVLQTDGRLVAAGSSTRTGEGGFDFALARYLSGLVGPPLKKKQCKHEGWREFTMPRTFKNQGDCISFVEEGR